MGNSNESKSFLKKGQGLRILSIKLNSPFDCKVEPFFDFIIDVICLQPQRSPKEILEKLTSASQASKITQVKDFKEIIEDNEERKLQIKIVSTKYRNVRSITITPNRNWNGSKDLIGITVRKQKYDEVFDTYFPVAQIQSGSPIQLAGVTQGQYLLGCLQFGYTNINNFIEGLYDRFFDKQVADKHVYLALYNIVEDEVNVKPVLLKRGWGGNGLLGCQFLQGQVYKFPSNFKDRRNLFLQELKIKTEKNKIKQEIVECDGASKSLVEALRSKRNSKGRQLQNIKNMLSVEIPKLEKEIMPFEPQQDEIRQVDKNQQSLKGSENVIRQQNRRIQFLESRIFYIEKTLLSVKEYLESVPEEETGKETEIQARLIFGKDAKQFK